MNRIIFNLNLFTFLCNFIIILLSFQRTFSFCLLYSFSIKEIKTKVFINNFMGNILWL